MNTPKTSSLIFVLVLFCLYSCEGVREEDKIFHAAPKESGFGGIYFGLYKDNRYQFCDGDFMAPGCYTGDYKLSGDTIIMLDLKKHNGIPTNRFLIRRYANMDSSYWQWKYPEDSTHWKYSRESDSLRGNEGDVFPLDENNNIVFDKNYHFVIRLDSLKNYR